MSFPSVRAGRFVAHEAVSKSVEVYSANGAEGVQPENPTCLHIRIAWFEFTLSQIGGEITEPRGIRRGARECLSQGQRSNAHCVVQSRDRLHGQALFREISIAWNDQRL